jgi:hypothetical protein
MYRVFISLAIVLALCIGCSKKDQVKRVHSKYTVYEMYLQRGIGSLNNFNSTHDSSQLIAAEHYLDSASHQKNLLNFIVVPRVTVYLLRAQLDPGRQYVESMDARQFPRPYLKEMYRHFLDALKYNKQREVENRDASMKKAVESVEQYLSTHSKDKDAISDMFSLKMYSEPSGKLFSDMDAYVKKYPDSKLVVEDLKKSLKAVVKKARQ